MLRPNVGVVGARWLPRSSKPVAGRAERAAVGSTPIHSRQQETRTAKQTRRSWFFGIRVTTQLPLRRLECKRVDAPRLTRSMHIALADLELDHLVVIYAGERVCPLSERVTVVPLGALLALATVALLAGCGGSEATETVPADEVPVVSQEGEGKVVAEAVIEPARWSELRFDAGGKVAELPVQEGDFVEAGDTPARLDTEILELALEEAQAALETVELKLTWAETEHEKAENRPWEWRYEEVQKAYTDAWQDAKDNLTIAQANYDAARAEQHASGKELAIRR